MRFKLALLTALPLALCAADKPSFSSTGYFTPECLASFPQAEFRQETEAVWKAALAEKPERLRLLSRLKAAGSPRSAAVAKRLEILDSLIAYIAARLEAGTAESLLFAWSAHEELEMLAGYFKEEAKLLQELENAPKPQNLSVRDFGARGDGKSDDGPAIRRALEAAAAAKSPVRLHFPAGTYRIEPESRPPERRAWRNRISGGFSSWNADTLNQAHLRLLSPEHLTLEGEAGQTRLLFTNPALCGIRILGGYHTTLRNLTLDYETPPFTQGRIVAANAERTRLEVEINEGFPSPLAPNLLKAPSRRLTPLSPETRTYLPGTFPLGKVEPLGGRKFRIELGSFHAGTARTSLAPGNPVVITGRYDSRCANAISSILSKFDHFDAITVHSSPSWTWHLLSYAPILQNCRVEPEPGTARLISTNGDGLMFAAIGKVGPYLELCTFSSMEDDGINLAASTVALTAVTPDGLRTLPERTMSNTSGVLILDGNTGKVKAVRRIVRRNGHPEYATPLPPGIATRETLRQPTLTEDQKREQKTMYLQKKVLRPDRVQPLGGCFSGSAIVNCTYRNVRGLGVQLTAPGVRVEDSTFDTITGPGVSITALCPWELYFSARNSVVRNCRFRNTGGSAIYVRCIPPYAEGNMEASSIHHLRLEGNEMETSGKPALTLWNCADVQIIGNRIRRNAPHGPAVSLSRIADIRFEDNTFQLPGGGTPFAFVDSAEEAKMKNINSKVVSYE